MSYAYEDRVFTGGRRSTGMAVESVEGMGSATYSRRISGSYGNQADNLTVVEDLGSSSVRRGAAEQAMVNLASDLAANEQVMCQAIVGEVQRALSQLRLHDKHSEVLEAITNIVVEPPDLSVVLEAVGSLRASMKHNELLEAVTNVVVDPPDLTEILRAIERLSVHDKHTEVLDAITNIVVDPPDLSPIETMIREIKGEIRRSSEDLRQEMQALRQDMAEARRATSGELEALRALIARIPRSDFTEVLTAIGRIPGPPDPNAIAAAVADRMRKVSMSVDNTEVLQALRRLELDPNAIAATVLKQAKTYDFGHGEVLNALRKIKLDPPDYEEIAVRLHERLKAHDFGHGEVLNAVRKIRIRETDLTPVVEAINNSEVDLGPIHEAIQRIPKYDHTAVVDAISTIKVDHDAIADRVHQKVRGHDFGHSEVLSAMRRTRPDHDAIASAVHEKVSGMDFGHGEVLQAIKKLKVRETDLTPVIDAINTSSIDLTPIHEAITNIDIKVDLREVLTAIKRINIDYDAVADAVAQRLDYEEMMVKALRRIRPERPDLQPVIDAINQIDLDLSPIMDAIRHININVDTSELMQAISNMRYSLEQLRLDESVREVVVREQVPTPTVQPQVPMATATVFGMMPQSPRVRTSGATSGSATVPVGYPALTYGQAGSSSAVYGVRAQPSARAVVANEGVTVIDRSPSTAGLSTMHRAQSSSPQLQTAFQVAAAAGESQAAWRSSRTATATSRNRSMSAYAPTGITVEETQAVETPRYINRNVRENTRRVYS